MSSSTVAATASGLAGAWFGDLASAFQGRWHRAVVTPGAEQQKLGARGSLAAETSKKAAPGGAADTTMRRRTAAAKEEEEEVVGACGGAMSDATLYLLLDRFTPN